MVGDSQSWQSLVKIKPDTSGPFRIELPRYRKRDGLNYDRLTSRWQLVRK